MDEWISVKDRLPDKDTEVIATDKDQTMIIGYIKYFEVTGSYCCYTPNDYLLGITHWMELPEPPEGE